MIHWTRPSALDRAPAARGEQELDAAWAGALQVTVDGDGRLLAEHGRPRIQAVRGARTPRDIFLGTLDGRPWFARLVDRVDGESLSWREVADLDDTPLAAAVFLARWHAQTPACERCGARTHMDQGGSRRLCPACGAIAFPRIDPCVIVAVTDPDDRLLLARNVAWPENRVSVLAGFVEAGESVEQAVHREVAEEVGASLTRLTYVASQPWPMPRSLMLGFVAAAIDDEVTVDGEEIVRAAYHTRAEVMRGVATGELVLPGASSIARHLIGRWLDAAPPSDRPARART